MPTETELRSFAWWQRPESFRCWKVRTSRSIWRIGYTMKPVEMKIRGRLCRRWLALVYREDVDEAKKTTPILTWICGYAKRWRAKDAAFRELCKKDGREFRSLHTKREPRPELTKHQLKFVAGPDRGMIKAGAAMPVFKKKG